MKFLDTTLRDGNQTIRENTRPLAGQHERFVQYASAASRFGMDFIEAGIPVAGPFYEKVVRAIADAHHDNPRSSILSFSRARKNEIDQAIGCVSGAARKGLALLTSVSDLQMKKFGATAADMDQKKSAMLEIFAGSVAHAAAQKPDDLLVYLEDSTRADRKYLLDLCQAYIENGATIISVPDTVGHVNDPEDYADLMQFLRENVRGSERVLWSAHCHNDRGLAVAMSLLVIKRKLADIIEGTINGFGERCGNTNLTTLFTNIYAPGTSTHGDHYRSEKGILLPQLAALHALGNEALGVISSPYEPLVGRFAHSTAAGMHQDGTLKDSFMFRSYDSSLFGIDKPDLFVFSDQSGRKGMKAILEARGINLSDAALDAAHDDAKKMAALLQGRVPTSFLEAAAWKAEDHGEPVRLSAFDIEDGEQTVRVSGVINVNGTGHTFSGTGDGATSAFVAGLSDVLRSCFGATVDIADWFECAATHEETEGTGREAMVWAFTRMKVNGDMLDSYGVDRNATHASFLACLQAVNRWCTRQNPSGSGQTLA